MDSLALLLYLLTSLSYRRYAGRLLVPGGCVHGPVFAEVRILQLLYAAVNQSLPSCVLMLGNLVISLPSTPIIVGGWRVKLGYTNLDMGSHGFFMTLMLIVFTAIFFFVLPHLSCIWNASYVENMVVLFPKSGYVVGWSANVCIPLSYEARMAPGSCWVKAKAEG